MITRSIVRYLDLVQIGNMINLSSLVRYVKYFT